MKTFLMSVSVVGLLLAVHGAQAAQTSSVVGCVAQVTAEYNAPEAATTCQGVQTGSDVNAVVSCVKQVTTEYNSPQAATACLGVKTGDDVNAVVSCVKQVTTEYNSPVVAAAVCLGVKS